MKFTVTQQTLLAALNITGKCIGKTNVPIVSNYLFKVDCDELSITGSNLELFLTKTIAIQGNDFEVSVAIPNERMLALISALPNEPLVFHIDKKVPVDTAVYSIRIDASCGTYQIPVSDGADYPKLPEFGDVSVHVDSDIILEGITKTLFACSNDDLRPAMTGLYFQLSQEKVIITATNALVLSTLSLSIAEGEEMNFIVPAKTMSILQSIGAGSLMQLKIDDKGILFKVDDQTTLRSRLIGEMYPDYRAIIPKNNDKILKADRLRLLAALKRVCLFSNGERHEISVNVHSGGLDIHGENLLEETASESLNAEYAGEEIAISMDGKLLSACLSKYESENIWLSFSKPSRAFLITDNEPGASMENLMLMMPIAGAAR